MNRVPHENRDQDVTMPWEKGKSGNPGGRPKEDAEVKALARQYGPEAVEKLIALMRGDEDRTCLAAANSLLDRGFGKPHQSIAMDVRDEREPERNELESALLAKGIDPEKLLSGRLDS